LSVPFYYKIYKLQRKNGKEWFLKNFNIFIEAKFI
jgi:hypothetical protein